MTPFQIDIPQSAIDDLKERLRLARFPDEVEGAGWDYGMSIPVLQKFVQFWAEHFDWRAAEARLNALPQFTTEIDGETVHFVHLRSDNAEATPLLLANGWPSNFAEYLKLIPLLADYHLIIPSLQGYGFSGRPRHKGMTVTAMSHLWSGLITELGYARVLTHSSDLGGGVVLGLLRNHPEQLIGVHFANVWSGYPRPKDPTPEEAEYFKRTDYWTFAEGAYAMEHGTKPTTVAVGLNDSPAGLAAWILEKYVTWGNTKGDLESAFAFDDLATILSIYWFTETIGSSQRLYKETFADQEMRKPMPKHSVPHGVLVPADSDNPAPRAWAERNLQNLVHFNEARRAGHFPALEAPQLLADDIRAFHRAIG